MIRLVRFFLFLLICFRVTCLFSMEGDSSSLSEKLWYAVACLDDKLVKDLLVQGVDPKDFKAYDAEGITLLHYAVARNSPSIVNLFLTCPGVNVNILDMNGNTPLRYAYAASNDAIIDMLLSAGADEALIEYVPLPYSLRMLDEELVDAVERNDKDSVRRLLLLGADSNCLLVNAKGLKTFILGRAAFLKENTIFELLLEFGAYLNPSLLDYITQSPLQEAGAQKNNEVALFLIGYGAYLDVSNPAALDLRSQLFAHNKFLMVLDSFDTQDWQHIISSYEKELKQLHDKDVFRHLLEAFLFAASQGHKDFISYILEHFKIPSDVRQRALVLAALNNYEDIFKLIHGHARSELHSKAWCQAQLKAFLLLIGQGHNTLAHYLFNDVRTYGYDVDLDQGRLALAALLRNLHLSEDRRIVYEELMVSLFGIRCNEPSNPLLPLINWQLLVRNCMFSFAYSE